MEIRVPLFAVCSNRAINGVRGDVPETANTLRMKGATPTFASAVLDEASEKGWRSNSSVVKDYEIDKTICLTYAVWLIFFLQSFVIMQTFLISDLVL